MAVQKREFEGVEHIDAVRLSTRRERRKGLIEKLRDNHNEPGEVLKPYITMAVLALLLSWAPFWPELLLVLTVFMALGFGVYKNRRLWEAPYRVPEFLGRAGYKDSSTGQPGNGVIYHGIGRGAYAGQEIWSAARDIQTHRMVIGTTGSGKSEEIFGLVFNALALNSGAIMVDGKASADTLNSIKKIARLYGRDEEFLVLNFMMGSKDFYGQSEVKLTNTFNPFAMGSSDQKSTLMETFIPQAEGSNSVFTQRALQLNKALARPLSFLQGRGYVDYNPRLLTEFFQLNNVENLVWFGRFRDKHGRVVDLPNEGKHDDFVRLKQACASLQQVLMDLPGYSQVMPKEPPPLIDADDHKIATALLAGEKAVEKLSNDMITSYKRLAGGSSSEGDKNQSAESTRAEVYRQWGYMTMSLSEPAALLTYSYGHVFNAEVGEINMNDVFLNRRIVYVMIPSLEKAPPSTAALGKITVAAVKQVLGNLLHRPLEGHRRRILDASPSKSQMPYPLIFDEYGYYVVEGFSVAAAQARSFGVSCTFGLQTPTSLEKASKQEADETLINTTMRHVGKLAANEDSEAFKIVRGWGGKKLTSMTRSLKVDHRAAFKTTSLSDEIVYEEEDIIKYSDIQGQESGQFHFIVGTNTREKGIIRGESRVVRYKAFYTGPVPEVVEWRLNHFAPVKTRDEASIEAIRQKDAQQRLLREANANEIRDWSRNQADDGLRYEDHLGGDTIATLVRDLAVALAELVDDPGTKPGASATIDDYAAYLSQLLETPGLVSDQLLNDALSWVISSQDRAHGELRARTEIGELERDLKQHFKQVVASWAADIDPAQHNLILDAFGVLVETPIKEARDHAILHRRVQSRVSDAAAAVAAAAE